MYFSLKQVNGKKILYPIMPKEGVSISYQNEAVIIKLSSAMTLTYTLSESIVLFVSRDLTNKVCGACGNFNGVTADDLMTSDGRNSTVMSVVAASWQAEDFFTW